MCAYVCCVSTDCWKLEGALVVGSVGGGGGLDFLIS